MYAYLEVFDLIFEGIGALPGTKYILFATIERC